MPETKKEAVQLSEDSDGQVTLTTSDSDRFIKTQREIVGAMRGAEDILAQGRKVNDDFQAMVRDIQAWCRRNPRVESCTLCPRMDDFLAVIQSIDEDEDGSLDDAVSALDLEMFSRNKFRITWLMLRRSEASGIAAFTQGNEPRVIYRAR